MRIYVTGRSGFIGKYVLEVIKERNHTISDYLFADALIHLAWSGLPNYTSEDHYLNIPEQINIIKDAVKNGITNIVITGTCLERVPNPPHYAKAKQQVYDFAKSIPDISLKWVRLFYVHGIGQKESCLLPKLRKAIDRSDKTFSIIDGSRDFMHVSHVANHLVQIAESNVLGIIDCCTGVAQSVLDFCKQQMPSEIEYLMDYPPTDYEPQIIVGNPEKLNLCCQN